MNIKNEPAPEANPFAQVPGDEPESTPETARKWYLERARANYAVIRQSFLTQGPADSPTPGPLAALVQARSYLPLDFFLLRLALARVANIETTTLRVWARLLSTPGAPVRQAAVSRAVDRLEKLKLVKRSAAGRGQEITLCREDGSGESWEPPDGSVSNTYFTLPFDYWCPGLSTVHYSPSAPAFTELKVAGKAMLLILLRETNGRPCAEVSVPHVKATYGLSKNTVDRGYEQLTKQGLQATPERRRKTSHSSGSGKGIYTYRALNHPFSHPHREWLRTKAKAAVDDRRGTAKGQEGGKVETEIET